MASSIKFVRPHQFTQYMDRFTKSQVVAYMMMPDTGPECNARCTGCHLFANAYEQAPKRNEDRIVEDIRALTSQGAKVMPQATELLLMRRWRDIAQLTGLVHILTNGIILNQKPELLDELAKLGIQRVVITGNLEDSGLQLAPRTQVDRAINSVLASPLELMVRVTLTSRNFNRVAQIIEHYRSMGVRTIQFSRYLELAADGPSTLTLDQTRQVFDQIHAFQKAHPYDKETGKGMYVSALSTLGTQFREEGKQWVCTAGTQLLVIGLDDKVYPCIGLTHPSARIGYWDHERKQMVLEGEFYAEGNQRDCHVYRALGQLKDGNSSLVTVREPRIRNFE